VNPVQHFAPNSFGSPIAFGAGGSTATTNWRRGTACLAMFLIVASTLSAHAAQHRRHHLRTIKADVSEKKIKFSEVPRVVVNSFQEHFPNTTIKGQRRQVREKVVYYVLEGEDSLKDRSVLFETDGTVVEVQESMEISAIPPALHDSVVAKYPSAVFRSAESITRDRHVEYDILMDVGKRKLEVIVNSAGKVFVVD